MSSAPTPTARRHDLDRLRILAVLLLFPFHVARIFNVGEDWYVKNAQESKALSWAIINFVDPWHMPLLFALAGAATWFALGHRTGRAYARERVKRLLVPLVFGLLVVVPPQPYLAQLRFDDAERSYPGFLSGYFTDTSDLSGYTGGLTPAHLWFILYLLILALVALPLLLRLRHSADRDEGNDVGRPWMLAAIPIALLLSEALPAPEEVDSPFTYLVFFVAGFLLVGSGSMAEAVRRRWPWFLLAGIATMTVVFAVWVTGTDADWSEGSALDAGFQLVESTNAWLWVLGLFGAAGAYLAAADTALLRYANEAAYPYYVLHQTVIVVIGYAVVGWDLGIAPKYAIILAGSVAATAVLYDVAVRRASATRSLFGLKPKRRPALDPGSRERTAAVR